MVKKVVYSFRCRPCPAKVGKEVFYIVLNCRDEWSESIIKSIMYNYLKTRLITDGVPPRELQVRER